MSTKCSTSFQLNDPVDVYDENSCVLDWVYAEIVEIDQTSVKIRYLGWGSNYDENIIPTNIKKIVPINTHSVPCIFLSKPPSLNNNKNTLLYDDKNKKYIIFFNKTHVIKYDILLDTYECIIKLPQKLQLQTKSSSVICNDILYIFPKQFREIITGFAWNLKTLKGDQFTINVDGIEASDWIYTYAFANTVHLLFLDCNSFSYGEYDIPNNKCSVTQYPGFEYGYFGFIDQINKDNKLIIRKNFDLFCFDLSNKVLENIKMKQDKIQFMNPRNALMIFKTLFMIIGDEGILIGDIKNKKWYECKKMMPGCVNGKIINTRDNYIHFIGGDDVRFHLKIFLLDLLPAELINEYMDDINKLVYGYVKGMTNVLKINNYPHHLTSVIMSFCPIFLYC